MNPINFHSFACKLNEFLQGLGYTIVTNSVHSRLYVLYHIAHFKIDYDLKVIYYLDYNDFYGTNGRKVLDFHLLCKSGSADPNFHTNIELNELKDIALNFVTIYKQILCKEKMEKMNQDFEQ